MKIKYLGHSCFLLEVQGKKILTDPFISSNPLAKDIIDIDSIECEYILVSHGHLDHVEDLERIYKNQPKCTLISNFELTQYFRKRGLEKFHPMGPGGKWTFDFGILHMVPECHSNSLPDGSYGGSPIGFVLESGGKTIYFAGDTGLHHDMKHIKMFHKLNLAFFPIGGCFTMDIDQAVVAAKYVGTKNVLAMHYDTNPMIQINKVNVLKKAKKHNIKLIFMEIGGSMEI